jgi:hypothetical protein
MASFVCYLEQARRRDAHDRKETPIPPSTRYAKKHAKASARRHRTARERLAQDRRQAQQAAEIRQQALKDLGLPDTAVAEIEGRLVLLC